MHYTERDKLTIVSLKENENRIFFDNLIKIILERPSTIIYCERDEKLYGIVSMGDIRRASDAGLDYVDVNTHFLCILNGEYMKARNIFLEKNHISEVPVVDKNNILLGSYSSENDLLYRKICSDAMGITQMCYCRHVALVRPCMIFEEKRRIFEFYYKVLRSKDVIVDIIDHCEILDHIDCVDVILFVDKDEREAIGTLFESVMHKIFPKGNFITCLGFLKKMKYEPNWKYLCDIKNQGVYVLNLTLPENKYYRAITEKIRKKFSDIDEEMSFKIPSAMYEDFFDDLYTEEYAEHIANLEFSVENQSGYKKLKDCKGQYCNITDGERLTTAQPKEYNRTIYFLGPCFVYGHYVEDKNTIESFLQKKINRMKYAVRVVNYGCSYDGRLDLGLARVKDILLKRGDIVIMYLYNRYLPGIPECNLADILEKCDVNINWMVDHPFHCNHKINSLYADAIYDALEPVISETVNGEGDVIASKEDFIKTQYIDFYFAEFEPSRYKKIGSIVMNCNPFTFGHRYLIEQALKQVDFLIVFVVEENRSVFSFAERFAMVSEGVADLEHILVVPSGLFILSQTTFPEYFIKTKDEDIAKNMENDITLFGTRIAPLLGIKCRFAGEEPEDAITNEYNLTMKRILPKYGIEFIEIPRKRQEGKYISASAVRRCLKENDMEGLEKLVPASTMEILFMKNE